MENRFQIVYFQGRRCGLASLLRDRAVRRAVSTVHSITELAVIIARDLRAQTEQLHHVVWQRKHRGRLYNQLTLMIESCRY